MNKKKLKSLLIYKSNAKHSYLKLIYLINFDEKEFIFYHIKQIIISYILKSMSVHFNST